MPKIKISKIAYGSLSTTIGDCTLGYSSGVSFKAQEVCGIYVDIPPVLSPDYSTLLWKYISDTDSFILTHVQGRHVEDRAMGRIFSYRAAFEVSRSEMNRISFSVADLMQSVPRIKHYTQSEKWDEETTIVKHKALTVSHKVNELSQLLLCAVAMQRRLFISIPTKDRVLRENGIFNAEELNTLLEAIDKVDASVRRYLSFAFCVDEHYQKSLDDVLITMYVRESGFKVPEGALKIDFEQLDSKTINASAQLKDYLRVMELLPGAKEPMLPLDRMLKQVQDDKSAYESLLRIARNTPAPEDRKFWLADADSLIANIRHFMPIADRTALSSLVASLDTKKDRSMVDQLISLRKSKRDDAMSIIEQGLVQLAVQKLYALGPDADKWMRFFNELKDSEGNPLDKSRTFYLASVTQMGEPYVAAMRTSVADYAKAHPRNAKDPRFELIVNALHLQNKKKKKLTTEPKSPSNSQMQEEKGRATDMVAKDSERCFDEFDSLYQQLQDKEKANTKKGKILSFIIGLLLGALVAGVACFMLMHGQTDSVPGVPAVVDTLRTDSLATDSLNADSVVSLSIEADTLTNQTKKQ